MIYDQLLFIYIYTWYTALLVFYKDWSLYLKFKTMINLRIQFSYILIYCYDSGINLYFDNHKKLKYGKITIYFYTLISI